MRYDGNATPPQWVDKDGIVIEKGTQLRIKLMNIRIEVTEMFGIGSVKEVCENSRMFWFLTLANGSSPTGFPWVSDSMDI